MEKEKTRYMISEVSKLVEVETHVLRYWEDELGLTIPRNPQGQRVFTEYHVRLFQQVRLLKEQGYQLKAIRRALEKNLKEGMAGEENMSEDRLENQEAEPEMASLQLRRDRLCQFQQIMSGLILDALEENNERIVSQVCDQIEQNLDEKIEKLISLRQEQRSQGQAPQTEQGLGTWREPYTEQEPYTGRKSYTEQEPYAERNPYTGQDSYTEQEPYAEQSPYTAPRADPDQEAAPTALPQFLHFPLFRKKKKYGRSGKRL